MGTTTTPTVAGLPAWEHGYTTGYGLHGLPLVTREIHVANIADELGIDGDTLTEWLDGVHDGQLDGAEEARIRAIRIDRFAAAQRDRRR